MLANDVGMVMYFRAPARNDGIPVQHVSSQMSDALNSLDVISMSQHAGQVDDVQHPPQCA